MCCVGRMVEETTHETTNHEFESRCTRIYPNTFFVNENVFNTGAATGTKIRLQHVETRGGQHVPNGGAWCLSTSGAGLPRLGKGLTE